MPIYWKQEPDEATADADITLWGTEQDGLLFVSGPIVGALLPGKTDNGG